MDQKQKLAVASAASAVFVLVTYTANKLLQKTKPVGGLISVGEGYYIASISGHSFKVGYYGKPLSSVVHTSIEAALDEVQSHKTARKN